MSLSKRLTDAEVAAILRCTPRSVQRLRRLGLIAYLPGKPPTIEELDLRAYIDGAKMRKLDPQPAEAKRTLSDAELEKIRERARKIVKRQRDRAAQSR